MQKLKLSEWASVAEIVASIVIVISLIYVGFEMNQNTQALRAEIHQNVQTILNEQNNVVVGDAEFHRIFVTAETRPDELSELEWSRFELFLYGRFGVWEYLHIAIHDNTITETEWLSFESYFLNLMCVPGYRRWWHQNRTSHNPDFIAYVDNIVAAECE